MKSLLAVSLDSLIMDVFIILAVVVACALVIYFAWEAVATFVGKGKSSQGNSNGGKKKEATNLESFALENLNENVAEKTNEEAEEQTLSDVNEARAAEEKARSDAEAAERDRQNAERRAYLEAKRQELIRRMQADMQAEEEEEKQDQQAEETQAQEESVETEVETETVETVEEVSEPQASEVEESTENAEEAQEQEEQDRLQEERNALAAEKEKYEAMVRELEIAKAELAKQKEQQKAKEAEAAVAPVVVPEAEVIPTNGVLSLEELKARLAEAEEKQKTTEKEFKQCKKEYTPLHKVWKTHEKDERKLRRKEALVAKQKVLLYGVNNYADIDEEKAKKLAEDLDLLDGLKLSVQHCEEVMEKNAERYPLLEKMYGVLKARNDELKADIAYYQEEIAKLEAEEESSDAE